MYRRVLDWLSARVGRGASGDDDSDREEGNGKRFVPSPLDVSVRVAHGGSNADVERELAEVEEQARALAGRRPDE